jgi:predicted ArsR family transcriptional regulator
MMEHAKEIAPSIDWDILRHIKCSHGMSVHDLMVVMKMSYMGVKQHCDALCKRGYLDTRRRSKGTGRPEKIYRATSKLELVLPQWGNEFSLGLLSLVARVYGDTAPERLLFSFIQLKSDRWAAKIKGSTIKDRAVELTKLRKADGWISDVVEDEAGLRIIEHHSPLTEVARMFPSLLEMETRMLSKLLGASVERKMDTGKCELHLV